MLCRNNAFPTVRVSRTEAVASDLLDWLVLANQPLLAVDHPALEKMLRTATGSPAFNAGGRRKFRTALMKKKRAAVDNLKRMLVGKTLAATSDIWTSNTNVSISLLLTANSPRVNDTAVESCNRPS